jgi:Tol biopolymer transport system component
MRMTIRLLVVAGVLGAAGILLAAFGSSATHRVTLTEGTNVAATIAPDGSRIIWIMRPDGSGVRQLTFGHGDDRDPRLSPDGTRIAFSSDRAFEGTYDIWVVEVATGALTRWTSATTDEFEPTWLPGGSAIAYVVGTGATGTTIQASDGAGTVTLLATAAPGTRVNSPSVSPDGTRVAYEQFGANRSLLYVSGVPVGTSTDVFPFYPNWLSNHELLYTADGKIRVTDLASSATREIPFSAEVDLVRPRFHRKHFDFDSSRRREAKGIVGPTLSPDGRQIVFQALNQIWLMPIGGAPRPLTDDRYYKCDPAWSPDGGQIAFSSDKSGTEDVYVLDLASGAERRVTSLPGAEVSATWSPDRYYTVAELMAAFQPSAAATAGAIQRTAEPSEETKGSAKKFWWHDPEEMIEDEHR